MVLSDGSVPQYREAQAAAKGVLPDAQTVDVNTPSSRPSLSGRRGWRHPGHRPQGAPGGAGQRRDGGVLHGAGASASPAKNVTGLRLEVAPGLQFSFIKRVHPALVGWA